MKNFLKNTLFFITTFVILIISIYYVKNKSLYIDYERFEPKIFNKKLEVFNNFIIKNNSINLILGSSVVEHSIIPDSIGPKWFAFAHGGQNIYESYKFINYFKEYTKFDSIIIGIQPFDFPFSYIKNRVNQHPYTNGNFHIFGEDSITTIDMDRKIKNIQIIKEENFFNISNILGQEKRTSFIKNQDVWSKQGYSGLKFDEPVDLRKFFYENPSNLNNYLGQFVNFKKNPNLYYFELFETLMNNLDIHVIYIIIPTPIYRIDMMAKYGHDKSWSRVKNILKAKDIIFWDFENINIPFPLEFIDENHMFFNSAKDFTFFIKSKLNEGS